MTILVVGASGATRQLLVQQLLSRGQPAKAIVRSPDKLPDLINNHDKFSMISASLLDLSEAEMIQQVNGCDTVASCLGHTMNFQGIYGHPRRLVRDAISRLCNAVKANKPDAPVKFVLMNTAGNRNRDLAEPISFAQKCVIGLIRRLVPPHADNEEAADYLRTQIGQEDAVIEWVVMRPDTLTDESEVTDYEVHASPTRSAIFNAGLTSRINMGHFMAELMTNDDLWQQWRGQMPVIYNKDS